MIINIVKETAPSIFCVKEQTPEICMAAVWRDASELKHVKDQTLEICLAAVRKDGRVFEYIRDKEMAKKVMCERQRESRIAKSMLITRDSILDDLRRRGPLPLIECV